MGWGLVDPSTLARGAHFDAGRCEGRAPCGFRVAERPAETRWLKPISCAAGAESSASGAWGTKPTRSLPRRAWSPTWVRHPYNSAHARWLRRPDAAAHDE